MDTIYNSEPVSNSSIADKYNFLLIALYITSFFYCLPIIKLNYSGLITDIRLYDLIFPLILWNFILKNFKQFKLESTTVAYAKYNYIFISIIFISLFLTYTYGGPFKLLIAMVRFYRIVSFWSIGLIIIVYIKDHQRLKQLIYVFYFNCVLQAFLGGLQTLDFLPNFWPDYWQAMYGDLYSVGTLAPHHKHIGIIMILTVGLSVAVLRSKNNILIKCIAVISIAAAIFTTMGADSRTGYGAILVYLIYSLLFLRGGQASRIIGVLFSIIILFYAIGPAVGERIQYIEGRQQVMSSHEGGIIAGNLATRSWIWKKIISRLYERPLLLLFGSGFQNNSEYGGIGGAHNNYLHILAELGLYGFMIYFLWLKNIYHEMKYKSLNSNSSFGRIYCSEILAIYVSILITMLIGETLYAQRAMMSLSGQLNILFAFGTHPLWLSDNHGK